MIKLATIFSGIGAVEFAMRRLNINHKIIFACDNGERDVQFNIEEERKKVFSLNSPKQKKDYVDCLYSRLTSKTNFVEKSYLANYPLLDKKSFYQDVILLDGKDYEGKVDLFVGGSPCQSFSSIGFQGGLDDVRGTLFYEYARLIKEIKPKVFIYENVRNLINHDHGNTWKVIKSVFDSLGYSYKYAVLNSSDYGIPQTRRRLFVVGFRNDLKIDVNNDFAFPPKVKKRSFIMKDFSLNNCAEGKMIFEKNGEIKLLDGGEIPDSKYTLSPKLYNYVMKPGTKNWKQKVAINLDVSRTILKTMGNRHRAGVDNYLSFDGTEDLGSVRMLTEREAHRLMGFTDDYKIVVSRCQAYKQAGNSIVVDVMMAIINSILETGVFSKKEAAKWKKE